MGMDTAGVLHGWGEWLEGLENLFIPLFWFSPRVFVILHVFFTVVLFEHQNVLVFRHQRHTTVYCVRTSGEGSLGGTGGHTGVYQEAGGEKTD